MYAEEDVAPAGSACGIVLLLYACARFSRLVWLSHPSCCESDFLLLKLLEYVHCNVPVFLTLAMGEISIIFIVTVYAQKS